ncbi:MAG: DUF6242 domain-containing protein [Tannerella sp.]|jgi:hypothetical protein|nr:DUF6242 domain-containing protein [Tannerella sp.]
MRKIKFCGLLIAGLACLMSSCLGGDESTIDDWSLSNAQIASFSLSNDSIAGLSSVIFTIDQVNGKIYNRDSMPYGTAIEEKVLCAMDFEMVVSGVLIVNQATNDSVYWNTEDSVDFSSPVTITVYSYNGVSTKTYEAKINIHQVNPDSMVWTLHSGPAPGKSFDEMKVVSYNSAYYMYGTDAVAACLYKTDRPELNGWTEIPLSGFPAGAVLQQLTEYGGALYVFDGKGLLYRSADGQAWSPVANAPEIKSLLGSVPGGRARVDTVLSVISKVGEALTFAVMDKNMKWRPGDEIPASFPVSGFGALNHEVMYYPYLTVSSGRDGRNELSNMAWSTIDGSTWVPLTNEQATFSKREGVAFFQYDGLFYVTGGIDETGTALSDVYYSKDRGVTWQQDTVHVMPEEYEARGFSSVIVDKNDYVLLFGGKAGKDTNILNELWRGRINCLGFGKE